MKKVVLILMLLSVFVSGKEKIEPKGDIFIDKDGTKCRYYEGHSGMLVCDEEEAIETYMDKRIDLYKRGECAWGDELLALDEKNKKALFKDKDGLFVIKAEIIDSEIINMAMYCRLEKETREDFDLVNDFGGVGKKRLKTYYYKELIRTYDKDKTITGSDHDWDTFHTALEKGDKFYLGRGVNTMIDRERGQVLLTGSGYPKSFFIEIIVENRVRKPEEGKKKPVPNFEEPVMILTKDIAKDVEEGDELLFYEVEYLGVRYYPMIDDEKYGVFPTHRIRTFSAKKVIKHSDEILVKEINRILINYGEKMNTKYEIEKIKN